MDIEWDDVRVFQAAVRAGDYSNAARVLGINRTTVGRRFARLERALGRRLWEQTTSGYRPTERGLAVLRAAHAMERAMARMVEELGVPVDESAAQVRVAGTVGLAALFTNELAAFRLDNPGLLVELTGAREAIAAVQQRHADLGLAVARSKPRDLAGVRVGALPFGLYAAPSAAARFRVSWGHAVMLANPQPWARLNRAPAASTACEVDNVCAMLDAVRSGLGAAWLWTFIGEADDSLVAVPTQDSPAPVDLWIVHRDDVALDPVMQRLRDFLVERIGQRIAAAGPAA